MDQLPILLLSKQLKYALSTDKVKTLEKAVQYLPKCQEQHKKSRITDLNQKYQAIRDKVFDSLSNKDIKKRQSTDKKLDVDESIQQNFKKQIKESLKEQIQQHIEPIEQTKLIQSRLLNQPFYRILHQASIIEVYGGKGTGKTSILLYLAGKYRQYFPNNNITILNCATGMTKQRLQFIRDVKYLDVFNVEQIILQCKKISKSPTRQLSIVDNNSKLSEGLLILDSLTSFFMAQQRLRSIINLFTVLENLKIERKFTIAFANFTYQKLQYVPVGKQVINSSQGNVLPSITCNHPSYFSFYHSEYINQKLFCDKSKRKQNFTLKQVKVEEREMQYEFSIGQNGVNMINII